MTEYRGSHSAYGMERDVLKNTFHKNLIMTTVVFSAKEGTFLPIGDSVSNGIKNEW